MLSAIICIYLASGLPAFSFSHLAAPLFGFMKNLTGVLKEPDADDTSSGGIGPSPYRRPTVVGLPAVTPLSAGMEERKRQLISRRVLNIVRRLPLASVGPERVADSVRR
jgi:hypothetical protein